MKNAKMMTTKNNRHAMRGQCSKCGTAIITFVKKPKQGTGIVTDTKEYVQTLVGGRTKYSPKVRAILAKVGAEMITGLTVNRAPVPSLITGFLKLVSTVAYDKLFHLSLIMTTSSGSRILVEKNEVINMDISPSAKPETESFRIPSIPTPVSITDFLAKGQTAMGGKYFSYSANGNNCQDYIVKLLTANGITDSNILSFVKQDTDAIFNSHPKLRKLANTITDIAGRADIAMNGSAIFNPNNDPQITLQNDIIRNNMRGGLRTKSA